MLGPLEEISITTHAARMEAGVVTDMPTGATTLQVRLLGELQLRRGGVVLPLPPSRRTRALLGYLFATAAPHSRSALCDLLWDGSEDPRASLRWSLTKLRPLLDDALCERLQADRERVGLDQRTCDVDMTGVLTLLAGGIEAASLEALGQATGALRLEFLEGLDLPGCYRFHHWCLAERERFGGLRRAVLQALVTRLADDPVRALPHGRAMVAADPLAEEAHATLVRLLSAVGRYPEAERHYEWARDLLRREIALAAGGVLDESIHHARRAQREGAAAAPPSVPSAAEPASSASSSSPTPPSGPGTQATPAASAAPTTLITPMTPIAPIGRTLVGRDSECEAITRALAVPLLAPLLLLTGEPGIGKTRLLDEVHARAAASGWQVIRGRCFEAERLRPHGLWLEALRSLPTSSEAGLSAHTLARAAPLLSGNAGAASREAIFEAAAALLRELAAQQPLALLLDDLQWIDEASAALLHFLVRGAAFPVFFAAAARSAEVDDNPAAKTLLQSLAREGAVRRLELGPLTPQAVRELLGASALAPDEAMRQSGGNPLYLVELVRAAERGGRMGGSTGEHTLQALIEDRLRSLDPAEADLLGWAAAMGGELRADLLAAAAGLPPTEVLTRLAQFERRALLVPTNEGHHDFAHDLVRQGVYRGMSQPRRRALHRQIAAALQVASAQQPRLHAAIVHHAGLAGDAETTVRACLAAGAFALRVFANAEAAELAERGLAQLTDGAPGAPRTRLEIGLLRLRVDAAAGPGVWRLPALLPRIEQTVQSAEALGLHAEAAVGWEMLAYCRQQTGEPDRALVASLAAERLARRSDAATHCRQLANSGRCLLEIEADPQRGRVLLDEAAALAEELDLKLVELEWGQGLVARDEGDLEAAAFALERAAALARASQNPWREYECLVWLATLCWEQGRDAEIAARVREAAAVAARMGEPQASFAAVLGTLARWRGGERAARTELEAHIAALRERDDKAHLAYALNEAAALSLAAGDREAAMAYAQEALHAAQSVRRPTEVTVAMARLACATSDRIEAASWLRRARSAGDGAPNASDGPTTATTPTAPSTPAAPTARAARAARALAEAAQAISTLASTGSR